MIAQTLKWIGDVDGFLELIDQRQLPGELVKLQCRDTDQLYEAIKTLAVRGAPAIGVSAAYGLVLTLQKLTEAHRRNGAKKRDARREIPMQAGPTASTIGLAEHLAGSFSSPGNTAR